MSTEISLNVEGMSCNHCKSTVTDALESVSGTDSVTVDLNTGKAVISGTAERSVLEKAVSDAGYKVS